MATMQPGCCDARTWNSIQLRMYSVADCSYGSICIVSQGRQIIAAIEDASKIQQKCFRMLPDKIKPAQPVRLRRLNEGCRTQ